MHKTPRRSLPKPALAASCVIAVACFSTSAAAQESLDDSEWKRGYHGFGALCRAIGLEPTDELAAWSRLPPEQSLLVILGGVDRLPLDLTSYLREGGALLIASDGGGDGELRSLGIDLIRGPHAALQSGETLHGYTDCPIVTDMHPEHPLTRGLTVLPANRPGALRVVGSPGGDRRNAPRWEILARLPIVREQIDRRGRRPDRGPAFLAALETSAGGRAVAMADQSVLSNQMLFYGDNALFASRMLRWLRNTPRTTVLIIDNRQLVVPPMPDLVEVEVPPPSPQEVRDALRNLPPELLVDFANLVVTTAEDEGLLDELVSVIVDSIPPRDYQRLLIFGSSAVLAVVVARRILARSGPAADETSMRRGWFGRGTAAAERQQAAGMLLNLFRDEVAGMQPASWGVFASGLKIAGRPLKSRWLRREISAAGQRLGPGDRRYWARWRLRRLHRQIDNWRRLHQSGVLQYTGASRSGTGPA